MGGLIAQRLAERGEVRAAVLVTSAPPRGITVMSAHLARKQLKYLPAILRSRVVHPAREDLRDLVLNCVPTSMQEVVLDAFVPDSGRAAREMSIMGVSVDAHRVKCPMLAIVAGDDRFIPRAIGERIANRYGAPFQVFEGNTRRFLCDRHARGNRGQRGTISGGAKALHQARDRLWSGDRSKTLERATHRALRARATGWTTGSGGSQSGVATNCRL
jgi:hypothetical protein